MSTSLNLRASLTKLATTQRTTTQCNNSFKVFLKASDRKFWKTQWLRHMTKWRRKPLVSQPPSVLSMLYINNRPEMSLLDPTSRPTGSCKDNASRTPKASHLNNKDLVRLPLTQLQRQGHGIINWFQWISIEPGHQEEIGEGEDEVHREGT